MVAAVSLSVEVLMYYVHDYMLGEIIRFLRTLRTNIKFYNNDLQFHWLSIMAMAQ